MAASKVLKVSNAIELSSNTDGYFNPTMGAVSDVWKNLFTENIIQKHHL